jgi:hypothetical protein
MAFPVVEATNNNHSDSASTSHTVNLPASISAGDLLVVFFGHKDTAGGATFPAGWTKKTPERTQTGSVACMALAWRWADGTEGATITVTTANNSRNASVSYRISGAINPSTQVPEENGHGEANTNSPNPPSLAPTGGAKDYLWLTAYASSHGRTLISAPTNYTNAVGAGSNSGTGTNVGLGTARRNLNASSEDPGAWSVNGTAIEETVSMTVAIHPAAGGLSATVNQVTETDTAQATAKQKVKAIEQNTETDLAQAVGRLKQLAIAQNTETDAVQAIAPAKSAAVGQVSETDTAQPITWKITRLVNQVEETDTSQTITPARRHAVAIVSETDSAQSITSKNIRLVAQVTEADVAQSITAVTGGEIIVPVEQVSETDTAQAITADKIKAVAQASGTDIAQPITRVKILLISQVSETDLAQSLFPLKRVAVAQVIEVDFSQSVSTRKIKAIGQANETNLAQSIAGLDEAIDLFGAIATISEAAIPGASLSIALPVATLTPVDIPDNS